jgi:hypothetical protein
MNFRRTVPKLSNVFTALLLCALLLPVHARANAQADPLPSWNDGSTKRAILSFVKEVTDKSGTKYVEPDDRIATFDQDGTLWVEHPLYAQATFALDRVHELASQHLEWCQRRNKSTSTGRSKNASVRPGLVLVPAGGARGGFSPSPVRGTAGVRAAI